MIQATTDDVSESGAITPASHTPLRSNEKVIPFDDGEESIKVRVTHHYRNEFTAIDHENYDYDSPVGYGDSELYAIADLFEKLPRARSEREERDHQAERWDHARDLRKHG